MEAPKILSDAKHYAVEVLGEKSTHADWGEFWTPATKLPIFLRNLYDFYLTRLFDKLCLLMVSITAEGETPASVRKHRDLVAKHFDGDIIYLVGVVSSYNRKRLIEQKVPFIVPGNQLYLPMLGIDLREYFKQSKKKVADQIGAVSQVLVLRQIMEKDCSEVSLRELALRIGYSPMSITRAVKELTEHDLASTQKVGREKHLVFHLAGPKLWQMAEPLLQDPVKKRVWIEAESSIDLMKAAEARIAGESALSRLTMLAEPPTEVIAVNALEWPGIKKLLDIEELHGDHGAIRNYYASERDVVEVEQWRYSPGIVTGKWMADQKLPLVDPLSLWLSFRSSQDERTEMASEDLIEHVWGQIDG